MEKPWGTAAAKGSIPGNLQRAGQIKSRASGLGLPTLLQNRLQIHLSQERPTTQEMRVWKEKRRDLFRVLAAEGGGRLKPEQPTSPLAKMDTSSFLKRGSGGYMQESRQSI